LCVSTSAFALTLLPGFRRPERSLLSRRDQGAALLVFTILGLIEEATVSDAGLLNERIAAVCAAGLVAGPWVGLAVGVFVTWLAVAHHGLPLIPEIFGHLAKARKLKPLTTLSPSSLRSRVFKATTGVSIP
jgi:hypothetical protein